jgi:Zn-dependent protease
MDLARAQRSEEAFVVKEPKSFKYTVSFGQPVRTKGRVYFSPKELKHLTVAVLLVIGVGLSLGLYVGAVLLILAASALILTISFFIHEIAHKVTAQRRGLWAEFRLTTWGAMITLLFMVLPTPFKLISPGAVMMSGNAGMEDIGKISIAGPVTNITLSGALLSAVLFGGNLIPGSYLLILLLGALINGYIAVFNLLPLGILDGNKIFRWNKKIWTLAFSTSVILTVLTYIRF